MYFPLVYGVSYAIGSIFVVLTPFREFFRSFDIYWSLNFSFWALSSSHNFYTIFKNSVRIAASILIGALVSYASLSMVGDKYIWANSFIFLVYMFLATGPMMSSKLLPFSFGKFMFISYYFLTFTEIPYRSSYYSPIIHLKFCLGSVISIGTVVITSILFRMRFGSGLFIKTTWDIFGEIKSYIRECQRQMNQIVLQDYVNDITQVPNEIGITSIPVAPPHDRSSKEFNRLKKNLDFYYYEYSNLLNNLDSYLIESKKEFGTSELIVHFEKIQILLERNHKKLFAIGFGIINDMTLEMTKQLVPLLPLIDQLISETENIFNTMENQLKKKYIHNDNHKYAKWFKEQHRLNLLANENLYYNSDEDNGLQSDGTTFDKPFRIDSDMNIVLNMNGGTDRSSFKVNSLEWHQYGINLSFKRVDSLVKLLEDKFIEIFNERIVFDPTKDNSLSKICFSIEGFISFTQEQKLLSKQVFLISYHLSLNRFKPREFKFLYGLFKYFKNYLTTSGKDGHSGDGGKDGEIKKQTNRNYDWNFVVEGIKYIIFKRILFNWVYSLKYSIVVAGGCAAIYEIQQHSDFILFKKLAWTLDTFIVISQPDVGAIEFVSIIRIIGTMFGGFSAYACVVLSNLGQSTVSSGFIYTGFSFFIITLFSFLVQSQPFEEILKIFVFTYSVISVPQFHDRKEDIIYALLKVFHVVVGVIIILLVSMIWPYFDFRVLEKNLFKIPEAIIDMVDFLLEYSFNIGTKSTGKNSELESPNMMLIPSPTLSSNSSNSSNVNSIIYSTNSTTSSSLSQISFNDYRELIGKKYIKLRRIFPHQRQLLIDSSFELIFQFSKYKKIETILYSIQELHNLFGALEFMIIQSSDQTTIRSVGSLATRENRILLNDLQHTSELLAKIPPVKDNIGFGKSGTGRDGSSELTVDKDNSIDACNNIIKRVNLILSKSQLSLSLIQFHRINAILYTLHCFVEQYHLLYTELVNYKNIIVIDKLNNNNYRNTNSEKDLKDQILNIYTNK